MAIQSMGCALENIMLAAHAEGLASFWISAPLFCPDAVREALDLPAGYEVQALIAIGYPAAGISPRPRPEPDIAALVLER
jgi:nitroreductase